VKSVGDFQTQDPDRLSEQLDRFQDAVQQETASIRAGFIPQLKQVRFSSTSTVTETVLPGQVALCDSSIGNVSVTLAAPVNGAPGWLAVIKRAAANAVTLKPSGSAGPNPRRINTGVSFVIAAVGVTWVYFDGSDWWA
jgi:hypothetical protein